MERGHRAREEVVMVVERERGNDKGRLCEREPVRDIRVSFSEEQHCVHYVLLKAFVQHMGRVHLYSSPNVIMVIKSRRMGQPVHVE